MVKIIAHFLPQFHAIPENNAWWREGYTEWSNVRPAVPLWEDHHVKKPHPDIGYYNLMDCRTRRLQSELAKAHGVYGFCYYHYWSDGQKLLHKPLEQMLEDGQPNLPFCLSWANERWEQKRSGQKERRLLREQRYGGTQDISAHIAYLTRFFRHPNYIRVDGKPMLLIYILAALPRYQDYLKAMREEARRHGFPDLHIVQTLGCHDGSRDCHPGTDAAVEFFPNYLYPRGQRWTEVGSNWKCDIREGYELITATSKVHATQYRGIYTGFDNSPRYGRYGSVVHTGGSPELFKATLRIQLTRSDAEFLFVNAWNEWGEGAVLEPDDCYGYAYVEAVRDATQEATGTGSAR